MMILAEYPSVNWEVVDRLERMGEVQKCDCDAVSVPHVHVVNDVDFELACAHLRLEGYDVPIDP